MKKNLYTAIIALSALAISCKKDNGANKTAQTGSAKISYFAQAKTINGAKSSLKLNDVIDSSAISPPVTWSSATIFIDQISFNGVTGNNTVDSTITVQKKVDMLSANPYVGDIQLPVGSYNNVKSRLLMRKSQHSDLTFELSGTFVNTKGVVTSLYIGNSDLFNVNLNVNNVAVEKGSTYNMVFNFELNKVLAGITIQQLENAYKDPNRVNAVYISSSVSVDLYNKIKSNWENLSSVYITKDGKQL
ncbi:hypothetical protein SAMN05192574_105118 [Mucilaginibacter gossypiicola]|uniref:DUF4382 domain-containing protein n=1 Tax=Mucilaginibacter gossypiicola TaxID=551995 RepID=A0A1H8LJ70_9SPHI|nr:hypothetical protein [Mucilaginibacter gossypiicola]SEO05129.1 hypothetical protein SAMN05192574_105118 [Mucilaginibacter gossypiicola]